MEKKVIVTRKDVAGEQGVCVEIRCSLDEELQIIQSIKNCEEGRETAIERLSQVRLRFIAAIAKRYVNSGLSIDELVAASNKGLLLAAKTFDESKGFGFMSYAVWWMRKSIENEIEGLNGAL